MGGDGERGCNQLPRHSGNTEITWKTRCGGRCEQTNDKGSTGALAASACGDRVPRGGSDDLGSNSPAIRIRMLASEVRTHHLPSLRSNHVPTPNLVAAGIQPDSAHRDGARRVCCDGSPKEVISGRLVVARRVQ